MSAVSPTRVIGGRYVVLAELGRGGMGIVWRAEDRVMGRHVAVKELHLPAGLSQEERRLFRERLLREARTAGRLNDPGIVTVYDVVSDAGVDHIVMELIEARTLSEVVAAQGPLDERAATAVAQALLAALGVAHSNGVVHRDVKPSNVMLAPDGRVKLTDFGIAQAADDPRLTSTGSTIGSPAYLAPERLDGTPATPASDLWALGVTLFHAVQGTSPFARDSTAATIAAVLHGEIPHTRIRGPLGTVISGLLQRDPNARLNGMQAAALLSAPGYVLPDPETTTRNVTGLLTKMPAPRRRKLWVWAAAALLVVGLVGGLFGGFALARAGQPAVTTLAYGEGGQVTSFEVSTPYCLTQKPIPGTSTTSSNTVPCDEDHPAEMFTTFDTFTTTLDIAYPGADRINAYGAAACRLYFDSQYIVGDDKSRLQVVALVPSEQSFGKNSATSGSASFSERMIYCVLQSPDNTPLTASNIRPDPV